MTSAAAGTRSPTREAPLRAVRTLAGPGTPPPPHFLAILFPQELNANLSNLTSAFEKATAEKIKCQQEADATNRVISLANR